MYELKNQNVENSCFSRKTSNIRFSDMSSSLYAQFWTRKPIFSSKISNSTNQEAKHRKSYLRNLAFEFDRRVRLRGCSVSCWLVLGYALKMLSLSWFFYRFCEADALQPAFGSYSEIDIIKFMVLKHHKQMTKKVIQFYWGGAMQCTVLEGSKPKYFGFNSFFRANLLLLANILELI